MKLIKRFLVSSPTKKICKDCRHFIGGIGGNECRKFFDTDIITGKVTYDYARSIRNDETKCGKNAIFFENNDYKMITVPYYFLKNHSLTILSGSLLGICLILLRN